MRHSALLFGFVRNTWIGINLITIRGSVNRKGGNAIDVIFEGSAQVCVMADVIHATRPAIIAGRVDSG